MDRTSQAQLAALRATVESGFARLDSRLDRLQDTAQATDGLLRGTVEQPGLVTRIDRLEQTEARRRWTIRALVAAVFTAIGEAFLLLVTARR